MLYVWDRAGIDFNQWHKWKQGSGIYMLSRCKANMALIKCGDLPFDRDDPINTGVQSDELVGSATGGVLMHARPRKPLQDALVATRLALPVARALPYLGPTLAAKLEPLASPSPARVYRVPGAGC